MTNILKYILSKEAIWSFCHSLTRKRICHFVHNSFILLNINYILKHIINNKIYINYIHAIWKNGNTFSQQPRETFSSNVSVTEESNSKLFGLLVKSSIVLLWNNTEEKFERWTQIIKSLLQVFPSSSSYTETEESFSFSKVSSAGSYSYAFLCYAFDKSMSSLNLPSELSHLIYWGFHSTFLKYHKFKNKLWTLDNMYQRWEHRI